VEFVVVVAVAVAVGFEGSVPVPPGFRLGITRGSVASPFGPPSSANFWRTIFGLFRSWAARSGLEPAFEPISRPSGVFQPDESGGEAASSEPLESTSSVKLPWMDTMLVLTYLCWWWAALGIYVYDADRGSSARETGEGSFSFMPISAAGVLYAEALLLCSPLGRECTGCTPSAAATVAMLSVYSRVYGPPRPVGTGVVRKGRIKCAALPPNSSGPYRAQDSGSARASVPVRRFEFVRDVEAGARLGTWPRGSTVLGLITTAPVSIAWLGRGDL
jgi:hypothetical protein